MSEATAALAVPLVLAAARGWACLRVQASWRRAIGPVWEWIAAAVALVVAGLALARGQLEQGVPAGVSELIVALLLELGLGTVIGLLVSLPGWALVGASEHSEGALGIAALDREGEGGALTRVVVAASLCAGLSLGLHAPLLAGLLGIFDRFALAQPSAWLGGLSGGLSALGVAEAAAAMTTLALALVTPVLLAQALVQLCLVSLGRADAGAAELASVLGSGLRLGAALLALGAAWSAYPEAFARGM